MSANGTKPAPETGSGIGHLATYRAAGMSGDPEALAGRPATATEIVNAGILAAIELRPGDTVVDIGCGDGSLLAAMGTAGRRIGTTSSAEEAAILAARHSVRSDATGIEFLAALADRLPIPDATADIVICNGVLLLLPDRDTVQLALSEIARIARPGAQIYIGEMPEGARGWRGFLARPAQIMETHGPAELARRVLRRVGRPLATDSVQGSGGPPSLKSAQYVMATSGEFQAWCRTAGIEPVHTFPHEVKQGGRWLEYPRNRWNYVLRRATERA